MWDACLGGRDHGSILARFPHDQVGPPFADGLAKLRKSGARQDVGENLPDYETNRLFRGEVSLACKNTSQHVITRMPERCCVEARLPNGFRQVLWRRDAHCVAAPREGVSKGQQRVEVSGKPDRGEE